MVPTGRKSHARLNTAQWTASGPHGPRAPKLAVAGKRREHAQTPHLGMVARIALGKQTQCATANAVQWTQVGPVGARALRRVAAGIAQERASRRHVVATARAMVPTGRKSH